MSKRSDVFIAPLAELGRCRWERVKALSREVQERSARLDALPPVNDQAPARLHQAEPCKLTLDRQYSRLVA